MLGIYWVILAGRVARSSMEADPQVVLQVLITKTDDGYEAHCLQMDIVTEAPSVESVTNDIVDLITAQYRYGRDTNNLEAVFVPAPAEYWQKLAHAKPIGGLRSIDLSGYSEHCDEQVPSYALQELEVATA
jgi:hypothetical protein